MAEFKITPAVEKEIKRQMTLLNCDYNEALDVVKSDWMIDHGERTDFDLSKEDEKKIIKEAHKGNGHKPTAYKFTKRERKANPTKGGIIQYLYECLADYENVVITNKERQIAFSADGNDYELTLVQKRKKKE